MSWTHDFDLIAQHNMTHATRWTSQAITVYQLLMITELMLLYIYFWQGNVLNCVDVKIKKKYVKRMSLILLCPCLSNGTTESCHKPNRTKVFLQLNSRLKNIWYLKLSGQAIIQEKNLYQEQWQIITIVFNLSFKRMNWWIQQKHSRSDIFVIG